MGLHLNIAMEGREDSTVIREVCTVHPQAQALQPPARVNKEAPAPCGPGTALADSVSPTSKAHS